MENVTTLVETQQARAKVSARVGTCWPSGGRRSGWFRWSLTTWASCWPRIGWCRHAGLAATGGRRNRDGSAAVAVGPCDQRCVRPAGRSAESAEVQVAAAGRAGDASRAPSRSRRARLWPRSWSACWSGWVFTLGVVLARRVGLGVQRPAGPAEDPGRVRCRGRTRLPWAPSGRWPAGPRSIRTSTDSPG